MSILKNLALQEIDNATDEISAGYCAYDDEIVLNDQINEGQLEKFWDNVVEDIHHDPTWIDFSKK